MLRFAIGVGLLGAMCVAANAQEAADGPGKDVFLAKCVNCHPLQLVTAQHKTRAEWETKVREMIDLGADLSSDDVKTIVGYLSAEYGSGKN